MSSKSLFPSPVYVLWLYGGVNGNLLQEGLCHTQVCCIQIPCPCSRPLLTHYSAGDTQTQFCLSLRGAWVLVCTRFFEPSEYLWWEWCLIPNANSPLLPSCWGFSFALGCGVWGRCHSRTYRLTGVSLILDVGYLLTAASAPTVLLGFL